MKLSGRTAFITGIGGFIGRHIALRAERAGMTIRGLESDESRSRTLIRSHPRWQIEVGDTRDHENLLRLLKGVDLIFHTAAVVQEDGDWKLFRDVNVLGTEHVARAAIENGVKGMVHLSSVMVYGFSFVPYVAEDGLLRGENNPYCQTKIEGERLLKKEFADRLPLLIVRPGDVYGPGSVPWILRPLELMRRKRFALPDRGRGIMNHVYIDNLIDGIFLAILHDRFGRTYNFTDGCATSFANFYDAVAELARLPYPPRIPASILRAGVATLSIIARITGQKPIALPAGMRYLQRPFPYSIERARRELGYAPKVSLREGLRRSIEIQDAVDQFSRTENGGL